MRKRVILNFFVCGLITAGFLSRCEKIIYTYDDQKPQITTPLTIWAVTDSSAEIYWETDEACHIKIKYGLTSDYGLEYEDPENCEIHMATLRGLEPHALYHLQVYCWDFADNGPVKSPDTNFTTLANEYSYLREGWQFFREKNYSAAKTAFDSAHQINPFLAEIQAAYGWLQIRTNDLDSARQNLTAAYNLDHYLPITLAGLAVISMIDDAPLAAINYVKAVLSLDQRWEYRYNPEISWKSLLLIRAQAYFQTNQMNLAQADLDSLWPQNGLNPNLPSSWVVNKQSYDTYETAFGAALNYLIANPEKMG
ncbi:MAG TPA: fibronectin type III domain-containing protein [Candidatus Marinimicrobia bacterium]|nr:fibronectin type III domain-containing protein [Candidatus Neomarinimicrobiota bacterium]